MVDTVAITYTRVFEHPREEAFAWLTDYRADDVERAGGIIEDRTVLQRHENEILLEGELSTLGRVQRGRARIELEPPSRWIAHLEDRKGRDSGRFEYELADHPEGCKLSVVYNLAAPRLRHKLMLWTGKLLIRREIDRMWDGFADAMDRELASANEAE